MYVSETASSTVLFWIELVLADLVAVETQKQTRGLLTREFKLSIVVEWYYNNNKSILEKVNKFKIDNKKANKELDCWGRKH